MQIPLFIGCDWGSSNFRMALITRDGAVSAEYADARGIVALRQQGFERDGLILHLKNGLERLAERTAFDLSSLPLMISGMAGSAIGICEVPYMNLPLSLDLRGLSLHEVGPFNGMNNPVFIIPGLCSARDVMRGEETEALGLMAMLNLKEAQMILPGTHSKHLTICDGQIRSFKTYMTGELFQIISEHSILRHAFESSALATPDTAGQICFTEGLEMARSPDFFHQLFTLRSRVLLANIPVQGNIHRLSGLLIGQEVLQIPAPHQLPLVIGGRPSLQALYRLAVQYLYKGMVISEVGGMESSGAVWSGQSLMLKKLVLRNLY